MSNVVNFPGHHLRISAWLNGRPVRVCTRCGGVEGRSLTTECTGSPLHAHELAAVSNGHLDYVGGGWVPRSELSVLTIGEIKNEEFYVPSAWDEWSYVPHHELGTTQQVPVRPFFWPIFVEMAPQIEESLRQALLEMVGKEEEEEEDDG